MGARGPQAGLTNLQQQVIRLAQEPEYQHPDGSPNRSKIARELGCTRQAVQNVFARLLPPTVADAPDGVAGELVQAIQAVAAPVTNPGLADPV